MRKIILSIVLCYSLFADAQTTRGIIGEGNWLKNWTNFKSKNTDYKESSSLLVGVISQNTTLYKKDVYLLTGTVYVTNGATLTIESGTLIRGDYVTCGTLVITKGSKIIAQGDETDPIVFTSNRPKSDRRAGDWGGLIIFGEAPTNKFSGRLDVDLELQHNTYGGQNEQSNSGILKYVRIEFAGRKAKDFKALSGLSLAGVGNKTMLDYIQISFSNANSFECYGGNISLNHLVSFRAMANDFEFTDGIQCNIDNSIAIRNPYVSTADKSRCFKVQSYDVASNADLTKKLTNVTAKNITLLTEESDNTGLTREAVFVKEYSFLNMSKSIISGFNQCVLLDGKIKPTPENLDRIKLSEMQINSCNRYVESEAAEKNTVLDSWYDHEKFVIDYSRVNNTTFFIDTDIKKTPDYRMKQDQLLTSRLANN